MKRLVLGLLAVVAPVVACSSGAATSPAPRVVPATATGSGEPATSLPRVTVAMYSGREDPTFTLTRTQADELAACRRSGTATTAGQPSEQLGFRYFQVSGLEPHELRVAVAGAWLSKDGGQVPAAICPEGFSILRRAAFGALPAADAAAIPNG